MVGGGSVSSHWSGSTGPGLFPSTENGRTIVDSFGHFSANSSSPAVGVRCAVTVGSTYHGTALKFLPGFSTPKKSVAGFHREQEHSLGLPAAWFLCFAIKTHVNSRLVFFQHADSNLRMPLRSLNLRFLIIQFPRYVSIIAKGFLPLFSLQPYSDRHRCNVELLHHKFGDLFLWISLFILCYRQWHPR